MRRKSWLGLAAGCLAIAMLVSGCAVTDFVQSVVRQAADFFPDLAGSAPRGSLELDGRTIAQADVAAYAGPWDAVITPYYRQQLTGDEALVYDAIRYVYDTGAQQATLLGGFDLDLVMQMVDFVKSDWPQFAVSHDGAMRAMALRDGSIQLTPSPLDLEMAVRNAQALEAAQRVVDGIPEEIVGETAVARYLYETLTRQIAYQDSQGLEMDQSPTLWTAYGALVEGQAVCDGVAAAVQLVFSLAGLRCTKVYYTGQDVGQEDGHAWNLVWLEGAPVYLDVHAAMQAIHSLEEQNWTEDAPDVVPLTYFAMTDEDLERGGRVVHPALRGLIPACPRAPWTETLYDVTLPAGQADLLAARSVAALSQMPDARTVCLQILAVDEATYEAAVSLWRGQASTDLLQASGWEGRITLWQLEGGALDLILILERQPG